MRTGHSNIYSQRRYLLHVQDPSMCVLRATAAFEHGWFLAAWTRRRRRLKFWERVNSEVMSFSFLSHASYDFSCNEYNIVLLCDTIQLRYPGRRLPVVNNYVIIRHLIEGYVLCPSQPLHTHYIRYLRIGVRVRTIICCPRKQRYVLSSEAFVSACVITLL